jgi:hypothetical protein
MSNTIPQQPNGTPHALEEPEITRLWRVFVSQVPKLPLPRKTKTSPIPQVLKVSPEERKSMEERERVFGLDFRQFTNAIDQQGAFNSSPSPAVLLWTRLDRCGPQ